MEENAFAGAESTTEVIYQLVGAASSCWENLAGAGVFESDQALIYARDAIARLFELGLDIKDYA